MGVKLVLMMTVLAIWLSSVAAQEELYRASSKEEGFAEFDLTVTEIKREPRKSFLLVPRFHDRSAAGSRWLMCVYTDLAIRRGFAYWLVVYPQETSETLIAGFLTSATEDVAQTLGREFLGGGVFPGEPASVAMLTTRLCGTKRLPERIMGWASWVRPHMSDAERARDYGDCVQKAAEVGPTQGGFIHWTCMTGRGYVKVRVSVHRERPDRSIVNANIGPS